MTKSEKLINIINKLIQKEVRLQMLNMKQEILSEMRRTKSSGNVQSIQSIPDHRSSRRPNVQYSHNPVLNEILASTAPIDNDSGGYREILDKKGQLVNIVAQGVDGQSIDLNKPAVQGVLEAMNRNYSDVIQPVREERVQRPAKSTVKSPTVSNLRQSALSSMLSVGDDDVSGISIPDPFSEKEW